jgi:hypothetical protein
VTHRACIAAMATAAALFVLPAPSFAQEAQAAGTFSKATAWVPGISLGAGFASFGTEGRPRWSPAPLVASLRIELTRYLVVEAEWMQPVRGRDYREFSEFTPSTLNGQPGVYGLDINDRRYRLAMNSVYLLARSRMGRVSFLGGVGIGKYNSEHRSTRTRTGCEGAWLVHCQGQFANGVFDFNSKGKALLVAGGIDVNVLPRLDAFVAGRIGGSNAGEEAAVAAGVRMAVVPERTQRGGAARVRRGSSALEGLNLGDRITIESDGGREEKGTLVSASASDVTIRTGGRVITLPLSSIKTLRGPDSLTNGVVIGMLSGVGLGAFLMYYDEPRTMPASILLGGAVGAFIDALVPGRKLYYFRRTAVRVAPAVTPKSVGVHVAW